MKKIILILNLFCIFPHNSILGNNRNGYAVLNTFEMVPLYVDSCSLDVIDSIANDSVDEVYYSVAILDCSLNRAYIQSFEDNTSMKEHQGWISWKHLGILFSCYTDTLYIREQPINTGTITGVIINPTWLPIRKIVNAYNSWLYVIIDEDHKIGGWISPECLCNNLYTICN